MTPSMTRLLPAITAALCLAASSITAVQAAPIPIPLVNGDFNTIYKPSTTTTAQRFNEYGGTAGIGSNVSVWSNETPYAIFSDTTTSSTVTIPGWTCPEGGVMTDTWPSPDLMTYRAYCNGPDWGVYNGATLSQTLSGVTAQANSMYTLSALLLGNGGGVPVTYQLWFGTTQVTATTPATWSPSVTPEQFSVQFATGSTAPTGDLKVAIVFEKFGTQTFVDNVTLTVVPEPAALGLLGLSALGLTARRRR